MLVSNSLIQSFINDNSKDAFNIIYKRYYNYVYFFIYSLVKNKENSEDILQDAFIKLILSKRKIKAIDKFEIYLIEIAKNTSFNFLKKNKCISLSYLDNINSKEDEYEIELDNLYKELNKKENIIVSYKLIYDLTFKEISKILNIKESQAYFIYSSSIEKIKDKIENV